MRDIAPSTQDGDRFDLDANLIGASDNRADRRIVL